MFLAKDLSITLDLESIDTSFSENAEVIQLVDSVAKLSTEEQMTTMRDVEDIGIVDFIPMIVPSLTS